MRALSPLRSRSVAQTKPRRPACGYAPSPGPPRRPLAVKRVNMSFSPAPEVRMALDLGVAAMIGLQFHVSPSGRDRRGYCNWRRGRAGNRARLHPPDNEAPARRPAWSGTGCKPSRVRLAVHPEGNWRATPHRSIRSMLARWRMEIEKRTSSRQAATTVGLEAVVGPTVSCPLAPPSAPAPPSHARSALSHGR